MTFRIFLGVLFLSTFSTSAVAQDDGDTDDSGRRVVYRTETEIDFEGVEVAGELVKPQGALLLSRKQASFNPLIKLRTDFDQEMSQSVNEVK